MLKRRLQGAAFFQTLSLVLFLAAVSPCQAKEIEVHITDMAYSPAQISVQAGDTVKWINDDFVTHSVTSKSAGWDIPVFPHGKARVVFKNPGSFDYLCRFHPTMKGSVTVER